MTDLTHLHRLAPEIDIDTAVEVFDRARVARRRRRRAAVAVLGAVAIAAAGVTGAGALRGDDETTIVVTPATTATTTVADVADTTAPPDALSYTVTMPAYTISSGENLTGTITVHNRTGTPIEITYCGGVFEGVLSNDEAPQLPFMRSCAQHATVPTGSSTYDVVVLTTYNRCEPAPAIPACTPDGPPPVLPPGIYEAIVVGPDELPPVPPVEIRVR